MKIADILTKPSTRDMMSAVEARLDIERQKRAEEKLMDLARQNALDALRYMAPEDDQMRVFADKLALSAFHRMRETLTLADCEMLFPGEPFPRIHPRTHLTGE